MAEFTREQALEMARKRLASPELVKATAKWKKGETQEKLTMRQVAIKGVQKLQVSTFDGRKTTAQNYGSDDLPAFLDCLLGEDLGSLAATTTDEEFVVTFSRKGRPLVTQKKIVAVIKPDLSHDRTVARLLPEGAPDPFLQSIGLMTEDGRIRADKQRKFRQINEFLRVLLETAKKEALGDKPLLIVDFGCGQAFLVMALHYYLNEKLGLRAELIGVDRSPELVESGERKAVGRGEISFVASSIANFKPPRSPDIVVALHACDTATDEALAKAIETEARFIFVAPCCHHHLQVQLAKGVPDPAFAATLKEPITRERIGDILTDTFRALLLRRAGYSVDVIEFTLPEHTPRNLMIRASRTGLKDPAAESEYTALQKALGITPYLEELLSGKL